MLVKAKVLIIDASESTRTFMRFILSNSGFRISVASTAAKALEEIEDQNFDVIVIDPRTPDMDGLDLVREIRSVKAFSEIPILAVTQFFNTDAQDDQKAAGISHWITQPVSPHKLIGLVDSISPAPEMFDDEMINELIKQEK
ncbi:MAG: response regulator [Gammaproteobacteria bacterium]|nr:response regulator [Gammaproteobacteria bacterium]